MPKTLHHQSVFTILVGVILLLTVPSIFIFLIPSVSIFCELQVFCHCLSWGGRVHGLPVTVPHIFSI